MTLLRDCTGRRPSENSPRGGCPQRLSKRVLTVVLGLTCSLTLGIAVPKAADAKPPRSRSGKSAKHSKTSGKRVVTIKVSSAHLREKPGTKGKSKTLLDSGAKARVVGTRGDWYKVRTESGREGWVRGDLVKESRHAAAFHEKSSRRNRDEDDEDTPSRKRRSSSEEKRRVAAKKQAAKAHVAASKPKPRSSKSVDLASVARQRFYRGMNLRPTKPVAIAMAKAARPNVTAAKPKPVLVAKAPTAARPEPITETKPVMTARETGGFTAANPTPEPMPVDTVETNAGGMPSGMPNVTPVALTTDDTPVVTAVETPVTAPTEAKKSAPSAASLPSEEAEARNARRIRGALSFRGTPYRMGATGRGAFDCSAFVRYIFAREGKNLPRTAAEQANCGKPVDKSDLKPGDLVFFKNTYKHGVSHVGIYIGNGQFIHASSGGGMVRVSPLSDSYYVNHWAGARRIE